MPIIQNKGLRGLPGLNKLSAEERNAFLKLNASKLKKYEEEPELYNQAANMLYNNQMFKQAFGDDVFKAAKASGYDMEQRNQLLRDKVINDAINEAYMPTEEDAKAGEHWSRIQELSTDAKEKLLNSDWKTPEEFEEYKKKANKDRENSIWSKAWSLLNPVEAVSKALKATKSAKDIVEGKKQTSTLENIGEALSTTSAVNEAVNEYARNSNQKTLDRIYGDDADSRAASEEVAPIISQAYMDFDITGHDDQDTRKKFVEAITPNAQTGNRGISAFAAFYGDGSEDQVKGEMEDFSTDDMRQILAKKAVYEQIMSPEMAATALNNEAQRYIKDHQGKLKRLGLFAKDVGISALSYTADKVNGVYNLGLMAVDKFSDKPTVWVDDTGNIVANNEIAQYNGQYGHYDEDGKFHKATQQQIARSTLHNMGKNEDGTNDESLLNPQYWTRAEQFGTLDEDLQKQYEQIGTSPYKVAYDPNEDTDLVYESFKMMSFGLADAASMLIPFGVGMAGRAMSTASKAGKVVQGLGKAMDTTGKYLTAQTRLGSTIQGLAGAGGIAYAYQRGAFQETLAQNLANAEEAAFNKSKEEVYSQYEDKVDDETLQGLVQQRFEEIKQSDEYAALQQKAIDSAGNAATTAFLPEAVKYGLVNTVGFRKFWYSNPKQMAKQAAKNFKGLEEVATDAGKKRLAVTSRFATMGDKAKQLGKVAGSQFWGGAWTNGTDDMMVDAAERINSDSFDKYLDAYQSGEAIADVYGFTDGLYSYWKGLQNSLGQETTWNAAAVGGFGGMVSATPNMANIAHLATKEGREAFKNTYQKKPVYETVDGIKTLKRNPDGSPVMEDVNWTENWRDRASYFIQNGVLNNYYANKASEQELQNHADYINEILDRENDFKTLTDLVASDIALNESEDTASPENRLSTRFIKSINTIRALNSMANDSHDPATLSSVVTGVKEMIDRASNGELTEEEATEHIAQYYAQHPGLERSDANNQIALENIIQNAKDLKTASEVYDKAEEQVQKLEKNLGRKIATPVRENIKLVRAWNTHWGERLQSLKDDIGDTTDREAVLSQADVIPVMGNKQNATKAVLAYAMQEQKLEKDLMAKQRDTKKLEDAHKKAQEALKKAEKADDRYAAQLAVNEAQAEWEDALQDELFTKDLLDKSKSKRETIEKALEEAKDEKEQRVLTADEIFALPAMERAQMMAPENREDYSAKQQQEIQALEKKLKMQDEDNLQKIQDIASITNELARKEDAYLRMSMHPEAAAVQLEKQTKAAADAAYELINKRNAQTLASFTEEMDKGLKVKSDVTQEDREKMAFGILKHYSPDRLDDIKEDNILPEFTKQIDDAKEWSQAASDVEAEVDNLVAIPEWKKVVKEKVAAAIESSTTSKEIMTNLETLIDNEESEQIVQSVEKVLSGLESKGHLRDTLVIENRKQRQEREEAAKKALEEEKKREEEAKKAAEAAVAKEDALKDNPKPSEMKVGEELTLEDEEKAETESQPAEKKVNKPSYHNTAKDGFGKSESSWKYYTEDESNVDEHTNNIKGNLLGATLIPAINYAVEAGVLGEEYRTEMPRGTSPTPTKELSDKLRDATKKLYSLGVRNPKQLVEYVEANEGKSFAELSGEPSRTVAEEEKAEEKTSGWGDMINTLMDEDAEAGSISAGEMWTGEDKNAQKGVMTVTMRKSDAPDEGSHLISFSVNNSPATLTVDGNAWVLPKEDPIGLLEENAEKRGITKEKPFNVKTMEKFNGEWYFDGNFAGKTTQHYLKVSEDFNLSDAIEKQRIAREAEMVASGIDAKDHNMVVEDNHIVGISPTIDQEVEELGLKDSVVEDTNDMDNANETGEKITDESINTLSGTAMPTYDRVILDEKGILKRKEGTKPTDTRSWFNKWRDTFVDENGVTGINLDEIVATELYKILQTDPHTKVRFMSTKGGPQEITADSRTEPAKDEYLNSILFLTIDYDDNVAKIHNKENGGVVSSEGKKYLIIGTVGYGDIRSKDENRRAINISRRDNLYNVIFGKGSNPGLLVADRAEWFKKHPSERFRILKDKKSGIDIGTEIIPGSLIPGYIVKQIEGGEAARPHKISELFKSKEERKNLKWGIQTESGLLPIRTSRGEFMAVRNKEANVGNVFVFLPAANGKLAPSYIKPLRYSEIQNGELLRRINGLLSQLVVPGNDQYITRYTALKELLTLLYFDKSKNNNILLGKHGFNNVTLVINGEKHEFKLDNFDSQKFMEKFRLMNPRVNVTFNVFKEGHEDLFDMYDEAGALTTDIAVTHLMGSTFAIYPIDAQGNMIVPASMPNNQSYDYDSSYVRTNRKQPFYKGQVYYYDANSKNYTSVDGKLITATDNPDLYESLEYNRKVAEGEYTSAKSTIQEDYYILDSGEHPKVIKIHKVSREVTKVSEEDARNLINEVAEKKAAAQREQNSVEDMKAEKIHPALDLEENPEIKEGVLNTTSGEDLTLDEETGDMDNRKPVGKPTETVAETTQASEKEGIGVSEKPRETIVNAETQGKTQDFKTLAKNKKYKMDIYKKISDKWADSPIKFGENGKVEKSATVDQIVKFLKEKGVNTEVIGTEDADIEAWIHTNITCK